MGQVLDFTARADKVRREKKKEQERQHDNKSVLRKYNLKDNPMVFPEQIQAEVLPMISKEDRARYQELIRYHSGLPSSAEDDNTKGIPGDMSFSVELLGEIVDEKK
jgi:hypothetical protein